MLCKKGVLRNFVKFTGKQLCQSLFFSKVATLKPVTLFLKKALAQVFSFEFCEISKNTFLHKPPLVAASVNSSLLIFDLFTGIYLWIHPLIIVLSDRPSV